MARATRSGRTPSTTIRGAHQGPDFEELHGDRAFGDDAARSSGGMARFEGEPCDGDRPSGRGRDTKEKLLRNFGMPRPEGYREALRADAAGGEVQACRCSTSSSTPRAPIPAWTPKSAASRKRSAATST
ncbi:MAG: hypothetical protein RML56_04120 [Burkholderiales bacterium]|nr:hypothetical protein [Burkholderiales bacterium]